MQVREIGLLLGGLVRAFIHGRLDGAGKDRVVPDVPRTVFRGEDLRQTDQPGFARRIGRDIGETNGVADKRAGEDDRAFALLQHGWDLMLGGEERARQIDLERLVPAFERNARGRSLLAEYAGVVEGDIEVAVALLRTLHQLFGKRLVADVARDGEGAASLVGNFTDEGLQFRLATSGDDDLGACASKQLCGRPSDTGARTRYDRRLALEINHATTIAGSVEGSRLGDSERSLAVVRSIAPPHYSCADTIFCVTRHQVLLLVRNCCVCWFLPDFLLCFIARFPSRSIGCNVIAEECP